MTFPITLPAGIVSDIPTLSPLTTSLSSSIDMTRWNTGAPAVTVLYAITSPTARSEASQWRTIARLLSGSVGMSYGRGPPSMESVAIRNSSLSLRSKEPSFICTMTAMGLIMSTNASSMNVAVRIPFAEIPPDDDLRNAILHCDKCYQYWILEI